MREKGFIVIEEKGKYLLTQEANFKWRRRWFVPGGGMEHDECPEEAAVRECEEETGFKVKVEGLFYVRYYNRLFSKKLYLFYYGKITGGELKTKPNKDSIQAKWFAYDEIKALKGRQKLFYIIKTYHKFKEGKSVKHFRKIGKWFGLF